MLTFIAAPIRKKVYAWLAAVNLVVGPGLGVLVLSGVIGDAVAQQVLSIAAQIMSAAGFILAGRNVVLPNGATIEGESSSN